MSIMDHENHRPEQSSSRYNPRQASIKSTRIVLGTPKPSCAHIFGPTFCLFHKRWMNTVVYVCLCCKIELPRPFVAIKPSGLELVYRANRLFAD